VLMHLDELYQVSYCSMYNSKWHFLVEIYLAMLTNFGSMALD